MKVKTAPVEVLVKSDGPLGQVVATFSRFGVVDADNDVTLAGAIPDGTEVPISSYGHTSWNGVLPVGKGVIRTDHQKAWVEAQFFMQTESGRDHFEVIRQLGPLQEWSYGYSELETDRGKAPDGSGRQVQFLKKLRVFEVSPVLRGSGIRTSTESAKDAVLAEYLRYISNLHGFDREMAESQRVLDREYLKFVRAAVGADRG